MSTRRSSLSLLNATCRFCGRLSSNNILVSTERSPIVNFVSVRQLSSNSLVHKLKSKFFPEEFVPEVEAPRVLDTQSLIEDDPRAGDYVPPRNIDEIIETLHKEHLQLWEGSEPFSDAVSKFRFLAYCGNTLGTRVGSSYLDEINSLEDLIEYYRRPVYKSSPLHRIKRSHLKPSNLVVFEDALKEEEIVRRGHLWDRWMVE